MNPYATSCTSTSDGGQIDQLKSSIKVTMASVSSLFRFRGMTSGCQNGDCDFFNVTELCP